jgi:hypothetical protein
MTVRVNFVSTVSTSVSVSVLKVHTLIRNPENGHLVEVEVLFMLLLGKHIYSNV